MMAARWKKVTYDPSHVANARGYEYFKRGAFDEAIKCYNSALATKGDFPEALSNRGAARLQKGDIHGAIRDCSQAVELAPNMVEALCNRGSALQQKGDIYEAIKDFSLAITKNADFAEAYSNRASAYMKVKKYASALKDCDKAFQIDPVFIEPCETAYKIYRIHGQKVKCIRWYRRMMRCCLEKSLLNGDFYRVLKSAYFLLYSFFSHQYI